MARSVVNLTSTSFKRPGVVITFYPAHVSMMEMSYTHVQTCDMDIYVAEFENGHGTGRRLGENGLMTRIQDDWHRFEHMEDAIRLCGNTSTAEGPTVTHEVLSV